MLLVEDGGFWALVKTPPCVCFTCPQPETLKGGRKVLGVFRE